MKWLPLQLIIQKLTPPALEKGYVQWVRGWTRYSGDGARAKAPTLFIDVSVITKHDGATGIQRVVRATAQGLLREPPLGWTVIPVSATRKRAFRPVDSCSVGATPRDPPASPRKGDVFLGLDFSLDDVHRHRACLARYKREGARLWFVVYDLLPITHPDWFSDKLLVRFRRWFRTLAAMADGFLCISASVEQELRRLLEQRYGIADGYRTELLPMGWDLQSAAASGGKPALFDEWVDSLTRPAALMVGTVEPRKGHALVLDAFEELWAKGSPLLLIMVGRRGWKSDALHLRLIDHPQNRQRLFWLEDASDEMLVRLYKACDGVIVASQAEGFGLPLIEAMGYGKRVLARNLPVFQGHGTTLVSHFPADSDPQVLAGCIEEWLSAPPLEIEPLPMVSWQDATRHLAKTIESGRLS